MALGLAGRTRAELFGLSQSGWTNPWWAVDWQELGERVDRKGWRRIETSPFNHMKRPLWPQGRIIAELASR